MNMLKSQIRRRPLNGLAYFEIGNTPRPVYSVTKTQYH